MAVNLATKYSDKIATIFTKESFLKGKTNESYDFTGAKTLKIYTPQTVPENDYVRSGMNRYGEPTEMQDTVQEMVMSQDKGFALTIDKGNNLDQMNTKGAGKMLQLQLKERSIPTADKYALSQWVKFAGKVAGVSDKLTKSTVTEAVADAVQYFDDHLVPEDGRYLGVSGEVFKFLKLAPEWIGVDKLGEKSLGKGVIGEVQGMKVVKIPTSYLQTDCYFVAWYKGSVMFPYKISDAKYHTDPPGLSGDLLEGRHYYDAFVLGAKADGVYAAVLGTKKQATPSIEYSDPNITITSSGAEKIVYTIDGSDPRYSDSAETYSAAVDTTSWTAGDYTIKAYATKNGNFTSDVFEKVITVS